MCERLRDIGYAKIIEVVSLLQILLGRRMVFVELCHAVRGSFELQNESYPVTRYASRISGNLSNSLRHP